MTSAAQYLSDEEELLYRQVHPSFIRDGRPTRQAFRPTPKDESRLSVARGSLTTPQEAHEHYTGARGLASVGTWALSVGEVESEGLRAFPDPLTAPPESVPDPAHAVVDFSSISKSQAEAKGAKLRNWAVARGRLHPPEEGPREESPAAG